MIIRGTIIACITATLMVIDTMSYAAPLSAPPHPHRTPSGYMLGSNRSLPLSAFLTKAQILAKVGASLSAADAVIKSAVLKTFGQSGHDQNTGIVDFEISPDRMVWEITMVYPKGLGNRGGQWGPNTRVVSAFDAQTGALLAANTVGTRKDFRPHHL